jgi:hypothetical protein
MTATLIFQNYPHRTTEEQKQNVVESLERPHNGQQPVAIAHAEGLHLAKTIAQHSTYQPLFVPDPATPVRIRRDVELLGERNERAYDRTPVGSWGAGPSTMAAAWPHLHLLGGLDIEELWFGPAHLVPSINRIALTKNAKANREERRRLHRLEITSMIDNAAGLKRVAIPADWNCRPSHAHIDMLRKANFVIVSVGATHGSVSVIDYWALRGLQVVSARRLLRRGSDHSGIEAEVR